MDEEERNLKKVWDDGDGGLKLGREGQEDQNSKAHKCLPSSVLLLEGEEAELSDTFTLSQTLFSLPLSPHYRGLYFFEGGRVYLTPLNMLTLLLHFHTSPNSLFLHFFIIFFVNLVTKS